MADNHYEITEDENSEYTSNLKDYANELFMQMGRSNLALTYYTPEFKNRMIFAIETFEGTLHNYLRANKKYHSDKKELFDVFQFARSKVSASDEEILKYVFYKKRYELLQEVMDNNSFTPPMIGVDSVFHDEDKGAKE